MNDKLLKPGSIFGGSFLIAGSCIGAGMLGMPIVIGMFGFLPSLILLFAVWLFMTYTALLLIEINGWFYEQVNFVTITEKSLGKAGKIISSSLYLFLFYSLLTAYAASSGSIFSDMLGFLFNININTTFAVISFSAIFGAFIYFGTKSVDWFNRFLMIGLIACYLFLVFLGLSKIHHSYLLTFQLRYIFLPLPILITSFGFHNMIPSLVAYMKGEVHRARKAIIYGSLIALFIYLIWIVIAVGVIPFAGKFGLLASYQKGWEVSIPLKNILKSENFVKFAQGFAFFAIVTSFIAQALSIVHFWSDGLKMELNRKNNILLVLLAVLPPTCFALLYPSIFFKALNFAGGFCAVILFGIMPVIMVWRGRYLLNQTSNYHVKGGKISLVVALIFSTLILLNQIGLIKF